MTRWAMVIDVDRCMGCGACVAACVAENLNSDAREFVVYKDGYVNGKPQGKKISLAPKNPPKLLGGLLHVESDMPPAEYFVEEAKKKSDPYIDKDPDKAKDIAQEEIGKLWLRTEIFQIVGGKYPKVGLLLYHRICQHCDNAPCVTVCPTQASFQRKDGIVLVDPNKCILCGSCVTACPYAARQVDLLTKTIDKCTFCAHRVDKGLLPACVETCPAHVRIFGDLDDPNSEVYKIVRTHHAVAGTPHGPVRHTAARVYYLPSSNYQPDIEHVEEEKTKDLEKMIKETSS